MFYKGKLKNTLKLHFPIICIVFLFTCIEIILFHFHSLPCVRFETDGIGYLERAQGTLFQAAPFHGPGYSFVIRFIHLFGPDLFSSAKIASILMGIIFVFSSWIIVLNLSTREAAILSSIIVAFNYTVIRNSIMIMSDMMAASLFLSSFVLIVFPTSEKKWKFFLAGFLGGLAYLTRHVYILIILIPFFQLFFNSSKNILKTHLFKILFFIIGFATITLPWCIFLFKTKGNPLWNLHHLNVAFSMYRGFDGWNSLPTEAQFSNIVDVIKSNPDLFISNFLNQLFQLPWNLIHLFPWTGILGSIGFFIWIKDLTPQKLLYLIACLLYGCAISLTWFEDRYYLPFIPLIGASLSQGLLLIPETISTSNITKTLNLSINVIPLRKSILVITILIQLIYSFKSVKYYLHDQSIEYLKTAEQLENYDLQNASLLAAKPHFAYFLSQNKHPVKITEFRDNEVKLQNVKLNHFPEILKNIKPTYFIYDERYSGIEFPQFNIFLDPKRNPYPENLEFLFQIDDPYKVVVYKYKK